MLRKIFCIMISLCILTSFGAGALASEDFINEKMVNVIKAVAPYITENVNESIKRGDCIATIMKVIGVDQDTADRYANACYYQPVFSDLEYDNVNSGYIILAKFGGVAIGIQSNEYDTIHDFEPKNDVTLKECLAFMLRCLHDTKNISWNDVLSQANEFGLLNDEEYNIIQEDDLLTDEMFKTLLSRMLVKKRYLYWPIDDPPDGTAKSIQMDQTDSIQYIDWILEKKNK